VASPTLRAYRRPPCADLPNSPGRVSGWKWRHAAVRGQARAPGQLFLWRADGQGQSSPRSSLRQQLGHHCTQKYGHPILEKRAHYVHCPPCTLLNLVLVLSESRATHTRRSSPIRRACAYVSVWHTFMISWDGVLDGILHLIEVRGEPVPNVRLEAIHVPRLPLWVKAKVQAVTA
jgi:hypothetical protein